MTIKDIKTIGFAKTPFGEKFGIPRQASLLNNIESEIHLIPPYSNHAATEGLTQSSHLWVLSYFHFASTDKLSVKPPRLGGNKKKGVFSTRSPFRPNPIGLSLVKLNSIQYKKNKTIIIVSGLDLVNDTPIIDIKPYIQYADFPSEQIQHWSDEYAFSKPKEIVYSSQFLSELSSINLEEAKKLINLIDNIFKEDPRPSYQKSSTKTYSIRLYRWDIDFSVHDEILEVLDIREI